MKDITQRKMLELMFPIWEGQDIILSLTGIETVGKEAEAGRNEF